MSTDERRISLRVKISAENGTAVMEMTGPAAPENGLQAFGDWVLAALEQHADGAADAARRMIAALQERDWEGDDVLADQLDALLGSGAMPDLRPLPVDLDELAGILEGDPMYGGGRVDLATGEVKDVLARWPGELDRWYAFSAERQRGRARAWLADAGYYVRKGLSPS